MGTWGTGITDNDLYLDIENEFFELYNEGISVEIITSQIIKSHNESLESNEDSNNFWLAVAECQWRCKCLEETVLNKVRDIITTKSDIELLRELGASNTDIIKREKILEKFFEKISTPRKSAQRRIRKKKFDSIFRKGDCLIFKKSSQKYGCALVIDEEFNSYYGLNLIIYSDVDQDEQPTISDLRKAGIIYHKMSGNNSFYPDIFYYYGKYFNTEIGNTELSIIGNLEIKEHNFKAKGYYSWERFNEATPAAVRSSNENRMKISDFLKNESLFHKIKNWL